MPIVNPPEGWPKDGPAVFPDSVINCRKYRTVFIHPKVPLVIAGAGYIQVILGRVRAFGATMQAKRFESINDMTPFCMPGNDHSSVKFEAYDSKDLPDYAAQPTLFKDLNVLRSDYDNLLNKGYTAAVMVTEPAANLKEFEAIVDEKVLLPPPEENDVIQLTPYCVVLPRPTPFFTNAQKKAKNSIANSLLSSAFQSRRTVVAFVGPKGAGKSTMCRYFANVMLSKLGKVHILDCDIGQPEFTPAGLLSLNAIDQPLLSKSFFCQKRSFENAYFYGDVTPEHNHILYHTIIDQLLADYKAKTKDDRHSVLFVNTCGWVEGNGLLMLHQILAQVAPTSVISINHTPTSIFVPSCLSTNQMSFPSYSTAQNGNSQPHPKSKTLRDYRMFSYLAQTFAKSLQTDVKNFNDVSVREVSFKDIAISIPQSYVLDESCYLAALNMSTVAFCKLPTGLTEEAFTFTRLMGRENLPNKVIHNWPVVKDVKWPFLCCLGYGFIRAISIENGAIYVITPIEAGVLRTVTVLALGLDINTPKYVFQAQKHSRVPYLMQPTVEVRGGYRDDTFKRLCQPLKIVGAFKRNQYQKK